MIKLILVVYDRTQNRLLREIFEPKRTDVTGVWTKFHNEKLHNLYTSQNIIRMIISRGTRCSGHVARMRAKRKAYMVLVGKSERKRPLGRPRRRLVCNIIIDLREI
jgi:hypothetical protein